MKKAQTHFIFTLLAVGIIASFIRFGFLTDELKQHTQLEQSHVCPENTVYICDYVVKDSLVIKTFPRYYPMPADTQKWEQKIAYLEEYNETLKGMLSKAEAKIDSLHYIETKLVENTEILQQLLRNEKENRDVLSYSLRVPRHKTLADKRSPKIQSFMMELGHIGNYPWQPESGFEFNQVRLGVGYSRAISERVWWYGKMSIDIYNGHEKHAPNFGVFWGYQYKW